MEFWLVCIIGLITILAIILPISYRIYKIKDTDNFCITSKFSTLLGDAEITVNKIPKEPSENSN